MTHRTVRVAIVDDMPDNVNLVRIQMTLASEDVDVVYSTTTSTDALLYDGWDDIDVAIVDGMMPGLAGEDLCRWLREEYPHVYLILWTAVSSLGMNASEYGWADLVVPKGDANILAAAAGALGHRRSGGSDGT